MDICFIMINFNTEYVSLDGMVEADCIFRD